MSATAFPVLMGIAWQKPGGSARAADYSLSAKGSGAMNGRGGDDALAFPSIKEILLAAWEALRSFCRATWRWTARAVGTAAVWLLCSATSWAADLPVATWQGQTMGSVYTVKIVRTNVTSAPVEAIKTAIERRLQEVNRQMPHYQKFFFDAQGRRLSHILDPPTGWPVQHDVGGVSVVAPDATTIALRCSRCCWPTQTAWQRYSQRPQPTQASAFTNGAWICPICSISSGEKAPSGTGPVANRIGRISMAR